MEGRGNAVVAATLESEIARAVSRLGREVFIV
jgi:hypothetical protein